MSGTEPKKNQMIQSRSTHTKDMDIYIYNMYMFVYTCGHWAVSIDELPQMSFLRWAETNLVFSFLSLDLKEKEKFILFCWMKRENFDGWEIFFEWGTFFVLVWSHLLYGRGERDGEQIVQYKISKTFRVGIFVLLKNDQIS